VAAFELSEEIGLPVIVRTTTRLAHIRGGVKLGSLKPRVAKTQFKKNPFHYVCVPAVSRNLHKELLQKYDVLSEKSEKSPLNQIIGNGKWGIVANGVSFDYVMDAVMDLGIKDKVSILKLGFSWPLPKKLIANFLKSVDKVLVVEELEPINENEFKAIAQENGITTPIKGKGVGGLSRLWEYDPRLVRGAVAAMFGLEHKAPAVVDVSDLPPLPGRPPTLCAGCPHRATFYAVKEVYGADAITPTDIGCYTLGLLPPISMGDFVICMGSSVSTSCGFATATDQKVVAFIGDSTFFHSGITGLINAVHNNHKFTLVILDNGTTAMTGHQIHPGVDTTPMGLNLPQVIVEDVVRGCGVKDLHVVKPFNIKKTMESLKASLEYDGMSVVVSKEFCPLFAKGIGKARKAKPFTINQQKCKNHRDCISKLACRPCTWKAMPSGSTRTCALGVRSARRSALKTLSSHRRTRKEAPMETKRCVFVGVGGQGNLLASNLLGQAALSMGSLWWSVKFTAWLRGEALWNPPCCWAGPPAPSCPTVKRTF